MTGAFDQVRLHVVTGKGGTGKTTVATALASAMAQAGHHVLLAEVEQRAGLEHLLDGDTLTATETVLREFAGGGRLSAVAADPRSALQEYLERYYKLGLAGKLVDRAGAVDFAASIAPGLRDVLLTGKIYDAVRRRDRSGAPVYDQVVLDAPPTGRVSQFLNVSAEVSGLAKVGPVHNQSVKMQQLLHSAETIVHLVTLPEEMPVAETIEAVAELADHGLPVGAIVVNQEHEPVLTLADLRKAGAGTLTEETIADGLRAAGLTDTESLAVALLADAAGHAERISLQRRELDKLKATGLPVVRLRHLPEGVDSAGVELLAAALTKGGLVPAVTR